MASIELIVTSFLAIALVASFISQRTKTPYTLTLVLLGLAISTLPGPSLVPGSLLYEQLVGGGLFVGLLLPALLFESMMSVDENEFRAVLRPSVLLATFGVVIATIVGGVLLWRVAGLPEYSAFLFAALIAPTDVATVLEIFKHVPVPAKLSTLMETEAALNDATGIALFSALLSAFTAFSTTGQALLGVVSNFLYVFGGGIAVGIAVAFGARFLLRFAKDSMAWTMLTIAAVYGSYSAATALNASGLVAVAMTGVFFGAFSLKGMREGGETVRTFWTVLAFIANTVAFLFIGLSTNLFTLVGSIVPILVASAVVMAARYSSVMTVLGIRGLVGSRFDSKWMNVATLGGMRGALSIVLVASIPAAVPGRGLIASMTLGVAFISIVIQGPLLMRYASRNFARGEPQ
jgi:monovalent cation:H+ antiporter, CPA1 family